MSAAGRMYLWAETLREKLFRGGGKGMFVCRFKIFHFSFDNIITRPSHLLFAYTRANSCTRLLANGASSV